MILLLAQAIAQQARCRLESVRVFEEADSGDAAGSGAKCEGSRCASDAAERKERKGLKRVCRRV